MSHRDRTDAEVAALVGLHQSEISANVGELQAATTIALGLLAYLASTVFLIDDDLPTRLLTLLPLGVIFGCTYQMLRAGVVVRRAAVAREYERQLARVLGFEAELSRAMIGSPFYGSVDDIGVIAQERGLGKWPRLFLAAVSYVGLYALSVGYTALIMAEVLGRKDSGAWGLVMCLVYVALWSVMLGGAWMLFRPREVCSIDPGRDAVVVEEPSQAGSQTSAWRRPRRITPAAAIAAPAVVAIAGVIVQFLQDEDPRFPLAYFTVLSAVLVALAPIAAWAGWVAVSGVVWRSGAAGTLVSGGVYWPLLAPTAGVGSGPMIVSANVLLHAVLPVVVLVAAWRGARSSSPRQLRTGWSTGLAPLGFPAGYLAVVLVAQLLFDVRPPYDFVDVRKSGWSLVAASSVAIGLLFAGALMLLRPRGSVRQPRSARISRTGPMGRGRRWSGPGRDVARY